jgi:hypothetical protein
MNRPQIYWYKNIFVYIDTAGAAVLQKPASTGSGRQRTAGEQDNRGGPAAVHHLERDRPGTRGIARRIRRNSGVTAASSGP